MGKLYDRLDDRLRAFIAAQPLFFVATARRRAGTSTSPPRATATTSGTGRSARPPPTSGHAQRRVRHHARVRAVRSSGHLIRRRIQG